MSTESPLLRMTRNGWNAVSTNVRKLQFTFTFQVTFVLVVSFFLGNAFLYETASRRLYQNQERLFRDRVLYLSNVIMAWEKDIHDTLEFVSANPSVRSLNPTNCVWCSSDSSVVVARKNPASIGNSSAVMVCASVKNPSHFTAHGWRRHSPSYELKPGPTKARLA